MMRTRDEIHALSLEDKLAFIKTCTTAFVVDAMNLLELKRWWLKGIKTLKDGKTMVAPAFTMRLERVRLGEPTHNAYDAVEICPPGYAMCIANIHDTFLIGGNVVAMANNQGVAGMVLEASNRDVREMRALSIPVFSQGVGAMVLNTDIPVSFEAASSVEIGGGKIYRDDILFGDDDGVIAIPREHLDEILYQLELVKAVEDEAAAALEENVLAPREFFDKIVAKKKKPRA